MARRSMTALRLALCAMLAACAGEEAEKPPPIGAGSGRSLAIHDAEVDEVGQVWLRFPVVHVGQTASLSVGLVNRSAEALDLGFVGPRAPFRFVDPPKRIGPGESVDVDVRFEPWEPGRFEADASIRSAGGGFALRLVGEARASPCVLVADPQALRFTAEPDETALPRRGSVRLGNEGEGRCRIAAVRVEGHPSFSAPTIPPVELEPGGSLTVPVDFSGAQGAEGTLVVEVDGGEHRILLGTKRENDCLRATDGGERLVARRSGCASARMEIRNVCAMPLPLEFALPPGFRSSSGAAPFLGPDEAFEIAIDFEAHEPPWERDGEILVFAPNGDRLRRPLLGRYEVAEEVFFAEPREVYHYLFVLDVAPSLLDFQHILDAWANWLEQQMVYNWTTDRRVHVITTSMDPDDGCVEGDGELVPRDGSRPRTVQWDTPNRSEVLRANLRAPACAESGGAGLAAIQAALGDGAPPWREGKLEVVIVSVEDDTSPFDVATFMNWLAPLGPLGPHVVDEISIWVPGPVCPGLPSTPRYLEAGFGHGRFFPICNPFPNWNWSPPWFDTQLVRLPPDLDGDGRIGPNDGVVILVDGQPYEGIWDLDPRGILSLLEVGPAEGRMVRRGSRIVVRYPRPCE